MNNYDVSPVHNGIISSAGKTALGAVTGGVVSALKTALWTDGIFAAIGAIGAAALAITFIPFATLGVVGVTAGVIGTAAATIGGAIIGGIAGAGFTGFTSVIAGAFGFVKGGSKAHERASQETGRANELSAQLQATKAQANAMTMAAATQIQANNMQAQAATLSYAPRATDYSSPDGQSYGTNQNVNYGNLPLAGTPMNMAGSVVSNAQIASTIDQSQARSANVGG